MNPTPQLEENKELVRRLFAEALSGANVDVIDDMVSPEFEFSYPNAPAGREGLKAICRKNHDTFAGWSLEIHQLLAEGDRVVAQWSATGVHAKSLMGETPTQKRVKLKGTSIYQVSDGKIQKDWVQADNLDFLTQLGALDSITLAENEGGSDV